MKGKLFPFTT